MVVVVVVGVMVVVVVVVVVVTALYNGYIMVVGVVAVVVFWVICRQPNRISILSEETYQSVGELSLSLERMGNETRRKVRVQAGGCPMTATTRRNIFLLFTYNLRATKMVKTRTRCTVCKLFTRKTNIV